MCHNILLPSKVAKEWRNIPFSLCPYFMGLVLVLPLTCYVDPTVLKIETKKHERNTDKYSGNLNNGNI